jgi:AcrR family transcriptional regulator
VRPCCGRDHQRHPRGHGQELAAVGYGRLSIEAVARRAGVGKTAIYRRWSTKLEMVLELVTEVAWLPAPLPDTGSLRADLELVLGLAARALRHRLASQIIPDLMADTARNPQIAETLERALRMTQRDVGGAARRGRRSRRRRAGRRPRRRSGRPSGGQPGDDVAGDLEGAGRGR